MDKQCGCIFDNFDLQLIIIIIHIQIIYIDEMSGKFSTDSLVPVTHQTSANIHSSNCEICEYCSSPALIQHSGGFTCLDCSRATLGVYHTDTIEPLHHNDRLYHKYPEEILCEITCCVGISQSVKDTLPPSPPVVLSNPNLTLNYTPPPLHTYDLQPML